MHVRIVACVAAVPNPDNVKWDRLRQLLDTQEAELVLNPVDRNALELAASLAKQMGATFDATCAGVGASAALREAAVFGAKRLVAIADGALENADASGVAPALAAAIGHLGGADVVFCGASTSSIGSGALPGLLSARLNADLFADAVSTDAGDAGPAVTVLGPSELWRMSLTTPAVVAAAPFGIDARAISPLLLMRASKQPIESVTLAEIGCETPLPATGATDGAFTPARSKKTMGLVEGIDAGERAVTLISVLRERFAL